MEMMSAKGYEDLASSLKNGTKDLNVLQLINLVAILKLALMDAEGALEYLCKVK